jgi:hypothetical protein
MNLVSTALVNLGPDYDTYREMYEISMESVRRHLRGLDGIVTLTNAQDGWTGMLKAWFTQMRELNQAGHSILVVGADCLFVKPWTFPKEEYMSMPVGVYDESHKRNSAFTYIPHRSSLWEHAEFNENLIDSEQAALNNMYFSQRHHAFGLDLNPALGWPEVAPQPRERPKEIISYHLHATRSIGTALNRMKALWYESQS